MSAPSTHFTVVPSIFSCGKSLLLSLQVVLRDSYSVNSCHIEVCVGGSEQKIFLIHHLDFYAIIILELLPIFMFFGCFAFVQVVKY